MRLKNGGATKFTRSWSLPCITYNLRIERDQGIHRSPVSQSVLGSKRAHEWISLKLVTQAKYQTKFHRVGFCNFCYADPLLMSSDTVLTLKLPEGYSFADLKVRRCDDDAIDLDMDLVKLICNINSLNFDKVLQNPGPVVTSILTVWYKSHLAQGGAPDALMEEIKSQGQRTN
jgi:hypothetical protein